jgi:hypothetical protein
MKLSWVPLKNAAAPGCTGRKASASRSGDASKRRLLADEIVADTHDLAGEVGDHVGVEVAVSRQLRPGSNGLHYHLEIFTVGRIVGCLSAGRSEAS